MTLETAIIQIYRVRRTKLHSMEKTPVVVRAIIAGVAAVHVRNHEMDIYNTL